MFNTLRNLSDCFKDDPVTHAKRGLAEAQRLMLHHQSAANYNLKMAEHYAANANQFKRFLTEEDREKHHG